ncbi:MFS family permease [Streptosporangium album]|uniref:MFS family permease n=1 Tax=Streptosporangium album TaxID=47479 RepID=A0A7W7WDL0_9ACTN|nr:MFS transporter [Streptosporangium album]MBB4942449.1 MFS family permease [Streptosporangium album]
MKDPVVRAVVAAGRSWRQSEPGIAGEGGSSLDKAAGVLLGGLLTALYGWRSVFSVMAPVALAVLVATWLMVNPVTPRGGRLDLPGSVTVTGGLVALTYGLSGQWPFIIAGLILLAVFVLLQRRSPDPLLPARMRIVARANALMAMLGAVWLGLFYYLPLYQQRELGYTPLEAGLTQLPLALMITLASWATPRLHGRAVLPGGLALLAAGLAWLARTPADGTFLVDLLGPSLLIGAGLGVAFVRLTALASACPPRTAAWPAGCSTPPARSAAPSAWPY